jgi:transcription initiation factor TFIIIB Brf1 subunit/transcription initiation factor TFIIB
MVNLKEEEIFADYIKQQKSEGEKVKETNQKCQHTNWSIESANKVCEDCGMVIVKEDDVDGLDLHVAKYNTDPKRCHARKNEEKGIFKDVEKLGFSDKIVSLANVLYEQVTSGKIYRGNSRKGIVFACIFHAYKINNNPQSCEQLIEIFGIERKIGLKGLKFVNLNSPKDSKFREFQINTENIICEIMDKFNANETQKQEAIEIYQKIKNKSSLLNRSRPQSVASGVVRYYIVQKNKDISMDFFKSRVHLSELTITRVVNEIENLLDLDM